MGHVELKQVLSISGNEVKEIGNFRGHTVYRHDHARDEEVTLYIVDKSTKKALCRIDVGADCGQNVGYIDSVNVRSI